MTLEEIYYVSQVIAVVAIIASLAAVFLQVRQTNMIARADLTHSAGLLAGQMQLSLFDSPEKADLMNRALTGAGPLSDAERARVEVSLAVIFGAHGTAFHLHQRNLIEVGAYNGLEAMIRLYLRSPHVQAYWGRHRGEGHDASYVSLLDGILKNIEDRRAANSKAENKQP